MPSESPRDAVIIDAIRTPLGKRGGSLAEVRPDDLAAHVLKEIVKRTQLDPHLIEDVLLGCATPIGEQGWNIARMAVLQAGFPVEVPAVTLNRMCASSDQAIAFAANAIRAGAADVLIAGGVESMSRVEMGSDGRKPNPDLLKKYPLIPQGLSAELMAEKYRLSRESMDAYSLESHERAAKYWDSGKAEKEISPLPLLRVDEGIRIDTSLAALRALKPAFKENGNITAGNSSQMSDGASAVLLMSREKLQELHLKPRAIILASLSIGSDPVLQLEGPIPATHKALRKAQLSLDDVNLFEVNEAFASVVLAWHQAFSVKRDRLNARGGAIAIGHPLGATGGRLLTTLVNALEDRGGGIGLQTMCIGHGMANATIVRVPG